jgi:hypothetical protein
MDCAELVILCHVTRLLLQLIQHPRFLRSWFQREALSADRTDCRSSHDAGARGRGAARRDHRERGLLGYVSHPMEHRDCVSKGTKIVRRLRVRSDREKTASRTKLQFPSAREGDGVSYVPFFKIG